MLLRALNEILDERGLRKPDLDALRPNIEDYQVLLYQPLGRVFGSSTRVGNMNPTIASEQCYALCESAVSEGAHLLVAPEYSFPWQALGRCLDDGVIPPPGALWVLGCESISVNGLGEFVIKYKNVVETLHEDITQLDKVGKSFFDPVVYLFQTVTKDGAAKTVAVVQFKTHPSIDPERIEGDNLCLGKTVYILGEEGRTIRLVTFICSDVFKADSACVEQVYDRALILHVQLNPNPREATYLQYRRILMGLATDETEIICLNWSQRVKEWVDKGDNQRQLKRWRNIGGSAWYLRPDKFDDSDYRLVSNHQGGLYYTYLGPKWHALFFNYARMAFLIKTSKVWHRAVPAVQSKRTGPRIVSTLKWHWESHSWHTTQAVSDGFANVLKGWGARTQPLVDLHASSPLSVERFLILTAGEMTSPGQWYAVERMRPFCIRNDEIIYRISYAQDTALESTQYRTTLVSRFVGLSGQIPQIVQWPPALQDLGAGLSFEWTPDHPHHNVVSSAGTRATVIYLGDEPRESDIKSVGDIVRKSLMGKPTVDRCCIVFRRNGHLETWSHPDSTRFDRPQSESPTSITGA